MIIKLIEHKYRTEHFYTTPQRTVSTSAPWVSWQELVSRYNEIIQLSKYALPDSTLLTVKGTKYPRKDCHQVYSGNKRPGILVCG